MDTSHPPIHKRQPLGLYILSFGEFTERFSYYGIQTIIVIYLAKAFMLSDDRSFTLYGAYAAFSFALPVLGGIVADRLIGLRNAVLFGMVFVILGDVMLMLPNFHMFCLGLAISSCGTGMYKPSCTSLVGHLYHPDDPLRKSGYTLFYLAMNIGATIAPIVFGFLAYQYGWSYSFLSAAIFVSLGLLVFILATKNFMPKNILPNPKLMQKKLFSNFKMGNLIYILIIFSFAIISIPLVFPIVLNGLVAIFAAIMLIVLVSIAMKYKALERGHIFMLLVLCAFGMFFYLGSLQTGSSINLFIKRDINHTIFNYTIPPNMFSSLYPFFVIVTAPFIMLLWSRLAKRQREPSTPTKIGFGLILNCLGFICFILATVASKISGSHYPVFWIVFGNFFLGAGEVCLTPTILYAISKYAPAKVVSTMMGSWFLFVAFSGYLSGQLAKVSNNTNAAGKINIDKLASIDVYQHLFIETLGILVVVSVLLFVMKPWIKAKM